MSLVKSRYLVVSDNVYQRPSGDPVRLVYATRRASLLSVDAATADALADNRIDEISPPRQRELARQGVLVDAGTDELAEVLGDFRDGSDSQRQRRFTIMPTSYCNMGCDYCGQVHYKSKMAEERVARLSARVEQAMTAPETSEVSVTWFGGEPLMGYRLIAEMSRRFMALAAEHGTAYSAKMATNGSLLTERKLVELHRDFGLKIIHITLDGPREIHDARRFLKNGGTSFDRCLALLSAAVVGELVPDLSIVIRINIDTDNEEHLPELLRDLAAAHLAVPQIELQLMPVHSWGNDVSGVELEARGYAEREAGWLALARDLGFTFSGLPTQAKATTCTATSRSGEIHDPAGRVYACSEHPLVPVVETTGIIAHIEELPLTERRPDGMFDDWYSQVAEASQPCHHCPFLPVCGGSCPKLWREGHLPCPSYRFNHQQRLDLIARRRNLHVIDAVHSARH